MKKMDNTGALMKKDTVDIVASRVRQFKENGELHLPANYSAENAMKSAWLILQSTQDKNYAPVLQSCTKDSIANSLLDMVVQGLNPAKKQCYFIAYGKQLTCMRSYLGTEAVAKNVAGVKDIYAQVVYKDDEFEYVLSRGKKKVTKHVQKIGNVASDKIVAAYCVVEFDDNEENNYTDIMTMDQIKKSWAKSKNGGAVQNEFSEEMAKRTVINRACKPIINSSNDSALLYTAMNRASSIATGEEVADEITLNANSEVIDIETGEIDREPERIEEPQHINEVNKEVSVKQETPDLQVVNKPGPGF
jgi:recombination protein RecT